MDIVNFMPQGDGRNGTQVLTIIALSGTITVIGKRVAQYQVHDLHVPTLDIIKKICSNFYS